MKKSIIIILVAAAVALLAVAGSFSTQSAVNTEFLRIHIRADSNSSSDQAVKYDVKRAVVEYLTPYLAEASTKSQAIEVIQNRLDGIRSVCDSVLTASGKTYRATVKLCREEFPDRTYGDVTLSAGVYDALIIELGSGSGNNWWCVVYPPLCFVGESNGTQNIIYKSRLLEIIRSWRQSQK